MNGAKKFHSPEGPAFNTGEQWVGSNNVLCWIVSTRRYGKDKWDVEVTYQYRDGSIFTKDAWNFQVRYQHVADRMLKTTPQYTPAYYDAEGGSMCNGIGREYF
jgi:hypothetical protein